MCSRSRIVFDAASLFLGVAFLPQSHRRTEDGTERFKKNSVGSLCLCDSVVKKMGLMRKR